MSQSQGWTGLYKVVLSLLIVYHLAAMVVLGNPSSIWSRTFYPFFADYANTLHINSAWRFFAPNPGGERYVSYYVIGNEDSEEADDEYKEYTWPPQDRSKYFRENFNRRFYHSILTTGEEEQIGGYLVPYLCKLHPEAQMISLRLKAYVVPNMEKTQIHHRPVDSLAETADTDFNDYPCANKESDDG